MNISAQPREKVRFEWRATVKNAFRPAVLLRLVLDCILDLEKEAEQMKLGAPLQAWGVQWLVELKHGAGDMEEFVEKW